MAYSFIQQGQSQHKIQCNVNENQHNNIVKHGFTNTRPRRQVTKLLKGAWMDGKNCFIQDKILPMPSLEVQPPLTKLSGAGVIPILYNQPLSNRYGW